MRAFLLPFQVKVLHLCTCSEIKDQCLLVLRAYTNQRQAVISNILASQRTLKKMTCKVAARIWLLPQERAEGNPSIDCAQPQALPASSCSRNTVSFCWGNQLGYGTQGQRQDWRQAHPSCSWARDWWPQDRMKWRCWDSGEGWGRPWEAGLGHAGLSVPSSLRHWVNLVSSKYCNTIHRKWRCHRGRMIQYHARNYEPKPFFI